jgi:hypothetical protein
MYSSIFYIFSLVRAFLWYKPKKINLGVNSMKFKKAGRYADNSEKVFTLDQALSEHFYHADASDLGVVEDLQTQIDDLSVIVFELVAVVPDKVKIELMAKLGYSLIPGLE